MPLHFNPALTGDFEGLLRFRAKYRNQWQSILGNSSFKTSAASIEYNLIKKSQREISIGFNSIFDKAGSLNFRTKTFNLSSSITQHFGNIEDSHHSLAIGFKAGIANRKIDFSTIIWPSGPQSEPINACLLYTSDAADE